MAVTTTIYQNFALKQLNGNAIDLDDNDTTTIKVALCTSSYTPSAASHDFFNDITNEVVATGYTAGGAALASRTLALASNTVTFDAADTTWSSSVITARYAVIYKDTGTAATSPLICYVDFGEDKSSDGDNFIISWDASGIFTVTFA